MDNRVFMIDDCLNPFLPILESDISPVLGSDLLKMSDKLNFSVVDASWFFGVTISAWYEYTSDPQEKINNRYAKKINKINEKRTVVLEKLTNGPDEKFYQELSLLDDQIKKTKQECEKDLLKLDGLSAVRALNEPVELPLALLYRVIDAMPDLIAHVSLKKPDITLFVCTQKPVHKEKLQIVVYPSFS